MPIKGKKDKNTGIITGTFLYTKKGTKFPITIIQQSGNEWILAAVNENGKDLKMVKIGEIETDVRSRPKIISSRFYENAPSKCLNEHEFTVKDCWGEKPDLEESNSKISLQASNHFFNNIKLSFQAILKV